MFCPVCTEIFADGALDTVLTERTTQQDGTRGIGLQAIPHHASSQSVREAAGQGCFICRRVVDEVPTLSSPTVYELHLFTRRVSGGEVPTVSLSTLVIRGLPEAPDTRVSFSWLELDPGDEDHTIAERSMAATHTGSPACLELAKHWLTACLEKHSECRAPDEGAWYPSRLLHLDRDTIRLISTQRQRPSGPYAAMSHCWGVHPIDVLTPMNFPDFQKGRSAVYFAPSFRDCFTALKHLGISYVWIDTFCILQGSSEESRRDWEVESLLMEKVYTHSVLNVAAAHGVDSRAGCFRERGMTAHLLRLRPIFWQPLRTFVLYRNDGIPEDIFNRHHLFSRAWVVQEMLLAPRLLHFGAGQLWWQCREHSLISEDNLLSPLGKSPGHASRPTLRPGVLDLHKDQLYMLWYRLLENYTSCVLSHPNKDKKRAIQGIADRIAKSTNDQYIEGYFWTQLPAALCWATYRGTPSPVYRAPSWSWASMDGPLFFPQHEIVGTQDKYSTLAVAVTTSAISINGTASSPGAALKQTALVCVGRPFPIPQPVGFGSYKKQRLMFFSLWNSYFRTHLDDVIDQASVTAAQYTFLPVLCRRQVREGKITFLLFGVVLEQKTDGTFRRRGSVPPSGVSGDDGLLQRLGKLRPKMLFLV